MIKLLSLRAAKFKQLDDVALAFPQRGSVLIQGLNEAGKSTLFESVYFALFGKGLVTEDNSGKLDDLINYQAPRALVKLAFTTDDATFIVSRSLNRGKPNTAVLDVEYTGGKQETITNLSAINRRIVEELRLDSEALLNSCFVEQKKLEKLEGMSAQQRRDTLLRLLNLDKLSALEAQYKPSSADEFQLEQLRSRVKLAELQRDLPAAEQRLGEIERQQRVVQALGLQRQIASETQAIERTEQTRENLQQAVEELHLQLSQLDHLKEQRDLARSAGEGLRGIDDESAEIDELQRQIALTQAQAAQGPELDAQVRRLEDEANRLAELARKRRATELLRGWLQIREVAAIAQQSEAELEQLRLQAANLEGTSTQRHKELATRKRHMAGWIGVALLAVVFGLTLGFLWLKPAFALLAVSALSGAWSWRLYRMSHGLAAALADVHSQAAAVHTEVHRREGEQALAQRTGQDPSRMREIELELAALAQTVPESVSEAHQTLRDLESGATSDAQLQTEAGARERAAAARAARQTAFDAQTKVGELEQSLAVRQRRLEARKAELESIWSQLIEQRPNVSQDVEACRTLWRELGDELTALDEPGLRRHAAEADQQLGATEQTLLMARQRVGQLQAEMANLAVDEASLVAAERALRTAVNATDEYPLDSVAEQLQQEQHDLLGRIASFRDQRASLEHQLELQGVAIDHDEAVRALSQFEEQTAVRKQSYRIVTLARKNIVGKVLPSTVRNMGLLLPLLTSDRYRDADIDPETYKIRVWDETARAMKAKDIFSGGTRDQFSLALRLAFALATLPEELGTAPGFIFLDEPLSSFDHQRGSALVDLLTRGPIAESFEQIFVISHNRSFDESLFDFHLELDSGRILDSDLPAPEQEDAQPHGQIPLELAEAR